MEISTDKIEFILNGKKCRIEKDESLMKYIREKENLTSVKNGCNQGACGACMILVDGKATKACLLKGAKIENKSIVTVEGLDKDIKKAFAYSFTKAGAVQCGFCIPGMVISAAGLFNKTLNPTKDEVKKALIGNICRCTGYVKIEEAILMAAEIIRENKEVPEVKCKGLIGDALGRVDAEDKTLGTGEYVDDLKVEGMVYGVALRAKYPRALVKDIDYSECGNISGVIKVITAKDVPGNRFCGHLKKDWPALIAIGEETRYVGDVIALAVAESEEIAKKATLAIKVDYEELKPLSNPEEAMKSNAPKIHHNGNVLAREVLVRGNVEEAINNSKYVVTNHYSVPFTEHAFLETECALAVPTDEELVVYTSSQSVYDDLHETTSLLGIEESKLRIEAKYVGGGFGGKEDMSCQH
ncbi:MAG: 2Fe-2S iron-sulfur cluster-binding protein, partial [Peptostreptococcaceae bacterium]